MPEVETAQRTTVCVNEVDGCSVEHPAARHVNAGEILSPCALFDPEPVEVPRESEVPIAIAVFLDAEPVPFAAISGEARGRRGLVRERTTVGCRDAVRVEGEPTGEGLHERGIRSYRYFVDLDGRPLIASACDAGSHSFERERRVVDEMMSTLDLTSER